MKKILAFSGSNFSQSINQKLVTIASNCVSKDEDEVEVISLIDFPAVMFGLDEEEKNGFS
ncbi:MAG: chromate reductase [Saprospiraceae bacterium]|jgi:chromate reductase